MRDEDLMCISIRAVTIQTFQVAESDLAVQDAGLNSSSVRLPVDILSYDASRARTYVRSRG